MFRLKFDFDIQDLLFGLRGGKKVSLIKSFPSFFPANCPPDDAVENELVVYRYTHNSPPTEDDFKSHYEIDSERYKDIVDAYSLSVISNLDSAKNGLELNPGLRKKFKYIASGKVTKDSGVIKCTPSKNQKYHMSWWLYKGIKPSKEFTICE